MATPSGTIVTMRSRYRQRRARRGSFAIVDEATEWCRGRNPWVRLPLLAYAAWLTVRYATDLDYQPIFDALNLGIHELGHIVFQPFGQFMAFAGGSLLQLVVPIGSMFMFYRQRDFFAITFCIAWLGMNLFDVAVYVADARSMTLPLVSPFGGDPMHDWNYLLRRTGLLQADTGIAMMMRMAGFACMGTFLWLGTVLLWKMRVSESGAADRGLQ